MSQTEMDDFTVSTINGNKAAWQASNHHMANSRVIHKSVIVPHMEWIDSIGRFAHRSPPHLPCLTVSVQVLNTTHSAFNRPVPESSTQAVKFNTIADTGAQTCACGPEIIRELGLAEQDLVPTSHRINGVTSSAMDILGVVFATISANGATSKQSIYVGRNIKGFFLSVGCLHDLGCISSTFPLVMPTTIGALTTCTCPTREAAPPRPQSMPFKPTKENIPKIEKWILDKYASSAFNICEHQPLPYMSGKPLEMVFKPEAKPVAYHTPIPIPHNWKAQVKADLDRDVRLGIIEPVPPGTPTVWCSRMVVVPKKDGKPRRTVDLQSLNKATYRLTHHTPSPFNQAVLVPPSSWKTCLDAWNGYHSMRLNPSASDATTFITEWGRYRYLRAPQGSHVAGDGYTKAFDDFTIDTPRKTKCIDDSLLWDSDIESSFWHTIDYITLCATNGVVFNPSKFKFARSEIEFAGFNLTWDGIRPSDSLLEAIKNFPKPQNITDARSWFGLVNQVAFSINTSETMQPFRELLKPGKWYWDSQLDNAFEHSKASIVRMIEDGVKSFEPQRPTCLATDWSKKGIGFTLLQKHCRCPMAEAPHCCTTGWRLIFAGSRFTTDAETRYAPIEGEALAVAYALEKCRMFVLGCQDLLVVTDHKPLTTILGDACLDRIKNPRLFRMKERTLPFSYHIKHVPGAWHSGPDACSRNPCISPNSISAYLCSGFHDQYDDTDVQESVVINHISNSLYQATLNAIFDDDDINAKAITLNRVREAASKDTSYSMLNKLITDGFPADQTGMPEDLKQYWKLREGLSAFEGICVYNDRIIIPNTLRKETLDCLHSAHQGVAGMKARASRSVFWPGLSAAISSRRAQCQSCNRIAPSQPAEPLQLSPSPAFPFECVVADYFQLQGHQYLVYADRYTGWITIARCSPLQANSVNLCRELRTAFGVYGAPRVLASDGGQPFASQMVQQFLTRWGVTWRQSSAYYAQSNGRAEVAVKTAKRLLLENIARDGSLDTDRFARALLQYRNTPLAGVNLSPAQMLYGRILRDHLPSLPDVLQIRKEWILLAEDRERALAKRHMAAVEYYDSHTKTLPDLEVGDNVLVQNQSGNYPLRWDKTGCVVEVRDNGQYVVRLDGSGRCTLRNRRFLKRCTPICADQPLRHPYEQPTNGRKQPDIIIPSATAEATHEIEIPKQFSSPLPTPSGDNLGTPLIHHNDEPLTDGAEANEHLPEPALPNPLNPPHPPSTETVPATPIQQPRRSGRTRRAPRQLTLTFHGKSYNNSCRSSHRNKFPELSVTSSGEGGM